MLRIELATYVDYVVGIAVASVISLLQVLIAVAICYVAALWSQWAAAVAVVVAVMTADDNGVDTNRTLYVRLHKSDQFPKKETLVEAINV